MRVPKRRKIQDAKDFYYRSLDEDRSKSTVDLILKAWKKKELFSYKASLDEIALVDSKIKVRVSLYEI